MRTTRTLEVSIWRDFKPSRPLLHELQSTATELFNANDVRLQQRVYRWSMSEGLLDSIADPSIREQLTHLLIERFNSSLPSSERSMDRVLEFIVEARSVASEWTLSQTASDDIEYAPSINVIDAFTRHLAWLHEMYSRLPGVSLMIR